MQPDSRTGTRRVFTLKEANDMVPRLNSIFENIFALNHRIKSLTGDIENLSSIWGKDVLENGHIDNEYYFSMVSLRENTFHEVVRQVTQLQSLGCIVKDVQNGLVDFYCEKEGDLVFLCWKYGEERIRYWHTLDGGFRTRLEIKK